MEKTAEIEFWGQNSLMFAKNLISKGVDRVILDILASPNSTHFEQFINQICKILDFEGHFEIKIRNFPYCLFAGAKDHIFFEKNFKGAKLGGCRNCRYNQKCGGIKEEFLRKFGKKNFQPIKDLPEEIMIEVESKCNFNCQFCYNKNSFASRGRGVENLPSDFLKKVIDNIKKTGIKIVRFTGGEPLLRKDIFELMEYAKFKNLEVRLNTNASLIDKNSAKKLSHFVDNILVPLEAVNPKEEAKISGFLNSFSKKNRAIKLLQKYGVKIVRAGTVATRKNIKNLEKFFKLVLKLNLDEWEIYRPIPVIRSGIPQITSGKTRKCIEEWSFKDVKVLVEKLIKFREISGKTFFIANGIPFCSYNKNKVNSVSAGALPEDGHIRFVIDPRGFAKPHYYFEKNIGNPLDILACWNHPFMKKMRNLEFAPEECKNCSFLEKCRGGSRYMAKTA